MNRSGGERTFRWDQEQIRRREDILCKSLTDQEERGHTAQITTRSGGERTYSVDHEQIRRREDIQCRS